ncbi:MAG: ABC transporter permease, partial [Saprospiraceae bacterium]|nr:ABC transporter permease [Saprospiraceae bacterium]
MNKLWLIIRREYLTRVKTKSFILTTILTPVAMLVFMAVVGVIFSYSGGDTKILIKDESNLLEKIIK